MNNYSWKPISEAPLNHNATVIARDEEGNERRTYRQYGVWCYIGWEENEDQEEFEVEICWNPIEFRSDNA